MEQRITSLATGVFVALALAFTGCGSNEDTSSGAIDDSSVDGTESSGSGSETSELGLPVAGLAGAPIPEVAVEGAAGPSIADEIASYDVPEGSDLESWYSEHVPSGEDLETGWEYCEDGPMLDAGDAGRIYTRPGDVGVDVLEITAYGSLSRISVLHTYDGLPC